MATPYLIAVPCKLLTDNGPEFTSSLFTDFLDSMGVEHQLTTPYHPTSNGAVERVNCTIQEFLRSLQSDAASWAEAVPQAVIAYNNLIHSELQMSPSKFLLSNKHNRHSPFISTDEVQRRWRVGHHKFKSFHIGQYVVKRIPVTDHRTVNKLSPKFQGPFVVIKVNPNNVTYLLKSPQSDQVFRAHHSDLHSFKLPPRYLLEHPWFQEVNSQYLNIDIGNKPERSFITLSIDSDTDSVSREGHHNLSSKDSSEVSSCETLDHIVHDNVSSKSILKSMCKSCQYEVYLESSVGWEPRTEETYGSQRDKERSVTLNNFMDLPPQRAGATLPVGCSEGVRPVTVTQTEFWNVSPVSGNAVTLRGDILAEHSGSLSSPINESNEHLSENGISHQGGGDTRGLAISSSPSVKTSSFNESDCTLETLEQFIEESFRGFTGEQAHEMQSRNCRLRQRQLGEGVGPKSHSTPEFIGRHTRSKGPVRDFEHVQPKILERKGARQ